MKVLKNFIQETSLVDLPLKGGVFIWSSLRDPPTLIRLDRFLVSSDFLSTFQSIEQHLLHKSISDHNAIVLINVVCLWGSRPFKFFNYQLDESGFVDMVISNSLGATGGRKKVGALKVLKGAKVAIKEWSEKNNNFSGKTIEALQKGIKDLESLKPKVLEMRILSKKLLISGLDSTQLLFLVRTHIALWFKAKFPDSLCSVDDLISDPSIGDELGDFKRKILNQQVWEAPPIGFLKLNVDRAMVNNGSKGCIGGIVRNNLGDCLDTFSLPIGPGPPIMAKLAAIYHGLMAFFSNCRFKKFRLILETNCSVAIEWILNSVPCPVAFEPLVRRCREIISSFSVVLRHVPRKINLVADFLAKEEVSAGYFGACLALRESDVVGLNSFPLVSCFADYSHYQRLENWGQMNENRQMEVHFIDTGFPYTATGSFMDFFEGLTHVPVNYTHAGLMHDQENIYWSMSMNAYKFGVSGLESTLYCPNEVNDHLTRMDALRTWDYPSTQNSEHRADLDMPNGGDAVVGMHAVPEECTPNHQSHSNSQVVWQDNIDPDNMTYEELLDLGEAVGSQSRGLSRELIDLLPTSRCKFGSFLLRKKSRERCVICQMRYKIGERQMKLPCKHVYHSECIMKWLSINKVCPVCNNEVFGQESRH
ncbi:hypothetical protein V6N11_032994 [Hibiscus sabdariffa]